MQAVEADCTNHLMLLRSKVVVVSDKGKGFIRSQVSVKELNKHEPLMMCRNFTFLSKPSQLRRDGTIVAGTSLLATGQAAFRRQELYAGLFTERGRLHC